MSTAFIFPGQGAQSAGMFRQLPDRPEVRHVLEVAFSLARDADACPEAMDSPQSLSTTRGVQLALLAAGVAWSAALPQPDMAAGHSVGMFAAAVVSGAMDFEDAVKAVSLRGRLMQEAWPTGYGMGVIVGLGEHQVSLLADAGGVWLAGVNSPDQTTVSGACDAVDRVLLAARMAGARKAETIRISVPSHCPLLEGVSEGLRRHLAHVRLLDPHIPLVGCVGGRLLRSANEVAAELIRGVAVPVRWHDALTHLHERGVRLFIEVGPGGTLTGLCRQAFPESRSLAVESADPVSIRLLMDREAQECR